MTYSNYPTIFKILVCESFQIAMTLKRHKNSIANVATATRPCGWRLGVFVGFGAVNPTLATSDMFKETPGSRDQQGSSIERPTGVYLFRHQ